MTNKDKNMNFKKEQVLTFSAFLLVLLGFGFFCFKLTFIIIDLIKNDYQLELVGLSGLFLFVCFLIYGNSVYFLSRYGYLNRLQKHDPAKEEKIHAFLSNNSPALTILLPSYKEEIPVIRQSILSSAFQNHPNRRIVLLIDNPPSCPQLEETRALVHTINAYLQCQYEKLFQKAQEFEQRLKEGSTSLEKEIIHLMMAYEEVVNWFEKEAELYPKRDHTDETFVNLTFEQRALSLRRTIQKLQAESLNLSRIQQEYTFLTYIFKVEVSSFERKQYQNFSHASNKSMNLNSYIDVLGKSFKESITEKGRILEECSSEQATHTFLDSPYIAVLDADSVLSYDYASRLIYEMEQPNFQNVAVIQTPYSAFPKPPGALERVAGATTDMQYLIHQGFSHFGATFWVGANALIRKKALEDIVEQRVENGYLIKRYVQDRTVIEDTESSIDLADKGWQLYNYPERLSYSATPPDFGSLIIQRKRWANGGLIILPKLIRYLLKNPFHFNKLKECFFRIHYLISIPAILLSTFWMQLSSYSLLDFPLESLLLTSPYLTLYGRDMRQYGYRYSDLLRVTALNLILLPVNLAGVLQSFKQILFGKHTRFFRTPKISGTTPIPLPYLFGEIFLFLYTFWIAMEKNRPESAFITLFFFYGLFYLIGMKDSLKELLYIQKLKASVFSRPFLKKQKESQLAIE